MMDHDEITFKAFATFICKHRNIKKSIEIVKKKKIKNYIHKTCTKNLHADPLTYRLQAPTFNMYNTHPST